MKEWLKTIGRKVLPQSVQTRLYAQVHAYRFKPPLGKVRFGHFRRLTPISRHFGFDRGQPVDRYYVEKFLVKQSASVKGRVLEIGDNAYTLQFGGERVTQSDVLHVKEGNPQATFVGDLSSADHLPSDAFDCVILTQTLQFIYDYRAALNTIHRILRPGGVLLATFPGLSQQSDEEWGSSWYWAFTSISSHRIFAEAFPGGDIEVNSYGNVLSAISFLQGLSAGELKRQELEHHDPAYEVIISVRAIKSS